MANRTLYELFQKESVLPTDIIPIQIDTVDSVLNKITVGQLKGFIHEDSIHILDITSTDEMKKLEIEDMYLDYIAGKSFTLYVVDNITIDSVVSKSYILAELIFSDVDDIMYKIYIKYNTIIDDNETITKKENSITAIVSKNTALVNGNIEYSTKDYTIYKDTYIDTVITNGAASKLLTARTISLTGDVTGSVDFDGTADVSITAVIVDDSHNHIISNVDGLQTALDNKLAASANAISASKWATARTISLTGDVTGSVSMDGTADVSITAVVVDDSHNHIISNVDGLQSVLDNKEPVITKLTGFNKDYGTTVTDVKMNGTQAIGIVDNIARIDHVHPTDTSRLASSANAVSSSKLVTARTIALGGDVTGSIDFDGSSNVTLTATVVDDSHNHIISNVDGLQTALDNKEPVITKNTAFNKDYGTTVTDVKMNGTQAIGIIDEISRVDHVHPVDTSRLASSANAVSSSKWATARTITLGGDLTGAVEFDGSANVTLTATVVDDSHNHIISNIDGLQTALDGKLASSANAVSASKLLTARTITLGGDVTGSVSFDGSTDVSITATIVDDSHNHIISNIDGLQTVLDSKEPVITKNTAFNKSYGTTSTDVKMNGTQSVGTVDEISRIDHVHPVDTSRLAASANAVSASKWATARAITLGGDLTGSVSIDGSTDVTLTATVADDSHNHIISNIDGLQTALDSKLTSSDNSVSASKWATARTITLGGDLTGSVSIDGSANVTLTAAVVDDSHNHIISNIDGLQTALDGKVDDSQVLTNVPAGAIFTDTVYTHPNHSGDVTSIGDGATTISANVVTNTKLADMATSTVKGRKTASTGDPEDISIADLKSMLALNNVTNVAQLAASLKGAVNGVAELDETGKVPSTQLPSYVDDVLEYADLASLPITGEIGKIYITLDTNKTYRWSGSVYTVISETLALGETSSTAYRGDRGKTAYDHSRLSHAPAGATINATDASLRDRTTHTGTQTSSTISDFISAVRSTVLTGLSVATNAAVTATDSILVAIGKLQKQITDDIASLSSHTGNASNPHSVTKAQVGLGSADNTADSAKNVLSATKLTTARTITLGGDLTGSVSINGSANVTLTATVADDSHNHIISNIDGLQTALDGKVDDSQVLTNVPAGAIFTDTVYTHPDTHSADIIVDGTTNKAYTAAEKTKLGNISGSNTGNETTTTLGTLINGATAKATPVDADMVALMDSAASNIVKKLSWLNIKATLKSYFDTLYSLTGHTHTNDHTHSNKAILDGTTSSFLTAQATKLSYIGVTQAVDLDTMESNIATNNAKVTNATHTGDVTGSGALTIANKAVTLAKMADMATASVIYRKTASAGSPEVQSLATLKADLGLSGTNSGDAPHPTQTAISSDNSNGVVIQDIAVNTLGHVTSVGTVDLATKFTSFATLTATTAATARWYRIATSPVNIGANSGIFKLEFSGTGVKGRVLFIASCHDGVALATAINQLGFSTTATTLGLTKLRLVYHTTPTANYAYLEVYNPTALAITYTVDLIDTTGWSLVTPSTAGSIPSGYSNEEITLDIGIVSIEDVIANRQLVSKIATGTAPLVVASTTEVANLRAATATVLSTARTINGVSFNGSANITVADSTKIPLSTVTTVNDFIVGTGAGAVARKTPSGVRTIITDASNRFITDTERTTWNAKEPAITKLTGFNLNLETTATNIKMNGTQAVGSLSTIARSDHVHPVDTSRLAASANAVSASKWATARAITLGGDLTGSVSIDGSTDVTLTATVADDSHNHIISNVDGLQTALDSKASTAVATTSVNGLMSSTDKTKLDGVATGANNYTHPTTSGNKHIPSGGASGQFLKWSSDGTAVWSTDNNTTYSEISEANITTGTATTVGLITGRRAKFIADRNKGTATPLSNGTAAVGTSLLYAREDHVHPSVYGNFTIVGNTSEGSLDFCHN